MSEVQLFAKRSLSRQHGSNFDQWLKQCAVVGAILSLGLVAMAVAGSRAPGPEIGSQPTQTLSFSEQHGFAHLENVPVHQIEDLTVVFAQPARP